jgi:hypothetical protein
MVKMMLLIVAVAACKSHQPHAPGQSEQCDSRVEDRQRWFTTPHEESDGRKPSDGHGVLGSCADKLVGFQPSCDKDKLRGIVGDSPHLHDALGLGFKTYVCELASDHSRTEYPLADVLTKRENAPRPVVRAKSNDRSMIKEIMAKLERFKDDMCQCQAGDKACAEQVEQALKDYGDAMKNNAPEPKLSDADTKKLMEMMTEMAKCQQAAMGIGDPNAP